jgi:hypothetical protein
MLNVRRVDWRFRASWHEYPYGLRGINESALIKAPLDAVVSKTPPAF